MGGGKNAASREAALARQEEADRQARIRSGMGKIDETFGKFDDDFYAGRRQSFVDFAQPQLDDQFADAGKELTYALARSGNLNSSARGEQVGELEKLYGTRKQEITDKALDYETQARSGVENARGDLVRTLNSTADADAATSGALRQAETLSAQPAYSPLSDLFANFTQALAMQAGYERAGAIDPRYGGRYNTGLFSPASSSVEVKR